MSRTTAPEGLRALGATTGSTALATALAVPLPHHVGAAATPHATVDTIVLAAVLLAAAAAATALSLGCWALTLATAARATGRRAVALERAASTLTPAVLRRVVAAGVGVGLGLVGTTTASAVDADLGWVPTTTTSSTTTSSTATSSTATSSTAETTTAPEHPAPALAAQAPGRAATVATSASVRPPAPPAAAGPAVSTTVTVQPGDTLWDLAVRSLGRDATDAEVAAAWPRWHEANRDVIGADPDVIRPGQVLTVPGVPPTAAATTGPAAEAVDR